MEGDTPAFFSLLNNGLASYRNPGWGGWGGRYIFRQPSAELQPSWTQGGDLFPLIGSVTGVEFRTLHKGQSLLNPPGTSSNRQRARLANAFMEIIVRKYDQIVLGDLR